MKSLLIPFPDIYTYRAHFFIQNYLLSKIRVGRIWPLLISIRNYCVVFKGSGFSFCHLKLGVCVIDIRSAFKSGQWHFYQDNAPVHNSILVTDYLTYMGIKTVPHPPYCQDLAPCDFFLSSKLRGCRYETIEEMKETVTTVINTLTQEDFHGACEKLLEQYSKCIAAGGDYFDGD